MGSRSVSRRSASALGAGWRPGPPAYYEIAIVAVAIVLVLHTNLIRRYGPAFAAVRADPAAARASGIPVDRLRFAAQAVSGANVWFAGALLALNAGVADPTSYGPLLSVKLFIVVLIGGAARRLGPAMGLIAVLVILVGWLVFKERGIGDKLIAASVMVVGVLILYLPVTLSQGITLGAGALAAMAFAFYLTRRATKLVEAVS